jgi:hypothetical protein
MTRERYPQDWPVSGVKRMGRVQLVMVEKHPSFQGW